MPTPKKILFVCIENAGRSQIAEGFMRIYAPHLAVVSAGTIPQTSLNPTVIEAMKEIGIDISNQKPKMLTNEMISKSIIVNMGCVDKESCPSLFVDDIINWNIPDPKGKNLNQVREIRNQIKEKIINFLKNYEMN